MVRLAVLAYLDGSEVEAATHRVAEPTAPFDPASTDTPDMSSMSGTSDTPVEIRHPRGQD